MVIPVMIIQIIAKTFSMNNNNYNNNKNDNSNNNNNDQTDIKDSDE